MPKVYITIQEAASLTGKSIQTIRRAIKSKKISVRKKRTPQGFNYLVEKESLCLAYNLPMEKPAAAKQQEAKKEVKQEVKAEKKVEESQQEVAVQSDDFKKLTMLLEQIVSQHSEERRNFLKLVNTLQEKIFVLENQVNLLKEPKKSWYQFW